MQSSRAIAMPIPDVGGVRNLQQVLTDDWRIFGPSLKLISLQFKNYAQLKTMFRKMREVGSFLKSAHIYWWPLLILIHGCGHYTDC